MKKIYLSMRELNNISIVAVSAIVRQFGVDYLRRDEISLDVKIAVERFLTANEEMRRAVESEQELHTK